MARGFESKSVADAQEAMHADKPSRGDVVSPGEKRLQLARADIAQRLKTVTSVPHRALLERALAALDEQMGKKA